MYTCTDLYNCTQCAFVKMHTNEIFTLNKSFKTKKQDKHTYGWLENKCINTTV